MVAELDGEGHDVQGDDEADDKGHEEQGDCSNELGLGGFHWDGVKDWRILRCKQQMMTDDEMGDENFTWKVDI